MLNVLELLLLGSKRKSAKHDEDDRKKAGSLRGGSGGWMSEDGKLCTGTCPRRAWARYKGYTIEDTSDKEGMFTGGVLSEDGICELLDYTWPDYKREQDVPTHWQTKQAIEVTGRPDIVLCKDGATYHGLELKLICSLWTALEVLQLPKAEHIIQAAHYSKQLNIPYTIVYVNRSNWSLLSDFAIKKAPREGKPGSEHMTYETYTKEGMTYRAPKDFKPFYRTYPMRWDEFGQVEVDNGQEWVKTFITWEGIERYYNFIAEIDTLGHCGPVPQPVNAIGDKKSYKACKYCNLAEHGCGKANMPLDKFKEICEKVHAEILQSRSRLFSKG